MNTTTTTLEGRIRARIEALKEKREAELNRLKVERAIKLAAIDAQIETEINPYNVAIGELNALIDGQVAS